MKKVTVRKIINKYDYILDDGKQAYRKNIEFYSKSKPLIGDIIYVDDEILDENYMISFDDLHIDNNTGVKDIIKVVSSEKEYYLQRIYG